MNPHLDRKSLRSLLDGALSEEAEKRLVAHLSAGDCPTCEDFLGTLEDEEEAELYTILERSLKASDLPVTARQAILESRPAGFWGPVPRLVPLAGLAVLALVALVASLTFALRGEEGKKEPLGARDKGPVRARAPGIDLTLGLVSDAEESAGIVRLSDGARVPAAGKVIMRVTTDGACYLYLLRVDAAGSVELLIPEIESQSPSFHPGGKHTPMVGGHPAGASLAPLSGIQHFVAGCSLKPLKYSQLKAWGKGLSSGESRETVPDMVSFDVVTVRIAREGKPR